MGIWAGFTYSKKPILPAYEMFELALQLSRTTGDKIGEADNLCQLATVLLAQSKDEAKAIELSKEGLLLSRQIQALECQANALTNLSNAYAVARQL